MKQIGGLNAIGAPLSPNRIGGKNIYYTKWSGLGIGIYSTTEISTFNGYADALLANGFTELRIPSDWESWETDTATKAAVISAVAKGAHVIWYVQSGGTTLTAANWSDFSDAVLAAAQWAQDNGVYEFPLGNEEEAHVDGTTLTAATLITNMKTLATAVQAIFTRGNVSYACYGDFIPNWVTAGKGDIDILSSNIYMEWGEHTPIDWKGRIDALVGAFGVDGTYLTEFGLNTNGLPSYSTDEAVQATAITGMINYIRASGMTRALYFCYRDPFWWEESLFEVLKDDGTYRKLWVSLLGSQLAVGQNKLINKWKANN